MPMSPDNPWRHPFRVPRIEKPRAEGRFHLTGGRRLGYAEYGDPSGPVVLWVPWHPRRPAPVPAARPARRREARPAVQPQLPEAQPFVAPRGSDVRLDVVHDGVALVDDQAGAAGLLVGPPFRFPGRPVGFASVARVRHRL